MIFVRKKVRLNVASYNIFSFATLKTKFMDLFGDFVYNSL